LPSVLVQSIGGFIICHMDRDRARTIISEVRQLLNVLETLIEPAQVHQSSHDGIIEALDKAVPNATISSGFSRHLFDFIGSQGDTMLIHAETQPVAEVVRRALLAAAGQEVKFRSPRAMVQWLRVVVDRCRRQQCWPEESGEDTDKFNDTLDEYQKRKDDGRYE